MANINLLPWRETRRQARRQQFLTGLCGAAFLAVLSAWLWDAVDQRSDRLSRDA